MCFFEAFLVEGRYTEYKVFGVFLFGSVGELESDCGLATATKAVESQSFAGVV